MDRYHACLHGSVRDTSPIGYPFVTDLVVEVHQLALRFPILKLQAAQKIRANSLSG